MRARRVDRYFASLAISAANVQSARLIFKSESSDSTRDEPDASSTGTSGSVGAPGSNPWGDPAPPFISPGREHGHGDAAGAVGTRFTSRRRVRASYTPELGRKFFSPDA
jgi:hypothetical protein